MIINAVEDPVKDKNQTLLKKYKNMPKKWKTELIKQFINRFNYTYYGFNLRFRTLMMSEVELDFIERFFKGKGYDL